MDDLNRRIRAVGRPGPAAFAEDCSLLMVLPDPRQAAQALEGFRRAGIKTALYAVSSTAVALEFLRGRDDADDGARPAVPLVVIIDASPLTPEARDLMTALRRDASLRYLTVVLLDAGRDPDVDGVSVTLHLAKPVGEDGYAELARRLIQLLPVVQ